jgi:hypothetical protein
MTLQYLGIIVSALVMFGLGGLWYSPMLFANAWARESGTPNEHTTDPKVQARFFIILLVLLIVAAALIDCVIVDWAPGRGLVHGLSVGFLGGLLASSAIGMDTLFERKSLKLFFINAGYYVIAFSLTGVILTLL